MPSLSTDDINHIWAIQECKKILAERNKPPIQPRPKKDPPSWWEPDEDFEDEYTSTNED